MHIIIKLPFKLRQLIDEKSITFFVNNNYFDNKLFFEYQEIEEIIREKNKDSLSIFYFNKENTSNILYEAEETINIDDSYTNKMSYLFYLDLLITDNPNFIDYIFSKETITSLYEKTLSTKATTQKIVMTKVLIDMIECFKGFYECDEKINEKFFRLMTEKCKNQIKDEINDDKAVFDNLEDLMEQSIDKIYMDIFLKFLRGENDSFSYDFIYKTLDGLEFDKIKINENMLREFNNFINSDKNINKYFIEKNEDLINIKKINFYYIILKYFLKGPIYIYQISFLLNTRRLLTGLIYKNIYTLLVLMADLIELDKSTTEKLDYIIRVLSDSEFYLKIYSEKKEAFKETIENKKLRYIYPLIQIIKEFTREKNNNDFLVQKLEIFEKLIKDRKFKKFPKALLVKFFEYFKNESNNYLLSKIFTKEEYKAFINLETSKDSKLDNNLENNDNIICEQMNDIPCLDNENKIQNRAQYEKEEVKEQQKEEIIEFEEGLLMEKESGTSIIEQTYTIKENEIKETEISSEYSYENNKKIDFKMYQISDKYKVIECFKVIETEKNCGSFFNVNKTVSNGYIITGLNSNKIKVYNSFFEPKLEIYLFDTIVDIQELKNENDDPDRIRLMACCKKKLVHITINLNNYTFKHYTFSRENYIRYNSFKQINNNYIIFGEKGVFKLFGKKKEEVKKIIDENYIGNIQLNENIYAFTSNNLFPKGQNKLVIYDFSSNIKILKTINDYSFDFSSNGLCLIDSNKIKTLNANKKILLCSCKKGEKHGILVINMDLEKKEFLETFHETKNFEPSCFCQISNISNHNSITFDITDRRNIYIEDTEYFLVGGFDPDKRIGDIKLYTLKYDHENDSFKIKDLADLGTEDEENNFKGFDMKITCITQSKITGNLLINCLDGNVFLFKPPNLECFARN